MKLTYRIGVRLFIAISIILTIWAVFFYTTIINEVNDEADDTLVTYSENVLLGFLSGDTSSTEPQLGNSFYRLRPVSEAYALERPALSYVDSMVYIPSKYEREPARIRTMIFQNENEDYYELMVAIPNIEKADLKSSILSWILFLYAGLLIVIIIINIWIYHLNTRPLYKLLKWLHNYKPGEKGQQLHNPTNIEEFIQLNEAVSQSMERVEKVVEEQKQFTGNASHEIQTPVAVAMARLEILMEDETLTERQLEEIAKTHQTLSFLAQLNKTLLLLYKIDNKQFQEKKEIDVNKLTKECISDLQHIYNHLDLRLQLHEKGELKWYMHEVLAKILVNNLLKNAYLHNISQGKINVTIDKHQLTVSNTSAETELPVRDIFTRFHQGKKQKGSTGLGLALVKAICDTENLAVEYAYIKHLHSFSIKK